MSTVVINTRTGEQGNYADWVAAFAALWADGRSSLDRFMDLLSADVRLVAPGLKSTRGRTAGLEAFRRTFEVIPDLTATVHRWSSSADVLFVEMTFHGTIGGREVRWGNVDRFVFKDQRAVERVAYFDSRKVRRAMLAPAAWGQLLRRLRKLG